MCDVWNGHYMYVCDVAVTTRHVLVLSRYFVAAIPQVFLDKYFSFAMKEAKVRESVVLEQGNMSVDEHDRKLSELSRYAPHLVSTPEIRARWYEQSLNPRIQNQLVLLMLTLFEELYHRSRKIERTLKESDVYEASKGSLGAGSSSSVRRFFR